jgi:hypothetical protein
MKQILVVCLAILFLCSVVLGANQKANFSGTWKQDPLLSDDGLKAPKKGTTTDRVLGGSLSGLSAIGLGGGGFGGGGMGGMGGGMGGMGGGMGGMGGGMGGMGGGMGGMGGGMGGFGGGYGGMGGGGIAGIINSAARVSSAVSGQGRGGYSGTVPNYGITRPVSETLEIKQTKGELQINNKKAFNGEDFVETYKLNGKDKVEMIPNANGSMVKQTTKIKLDRVKLVLTTTTMIPGGGADTTKREFTLDKEKGMVLRYTVKGRGFPTHLQKLYYNKG